MRGMALRYRLSMPEPHSHLFHVELTVDAPGPVLEVAMPVWTPGSYLVREYSRHVQGRAAEIRNVCLAGSNGASSAFATALTASST